MMTNLEQAIKHMPDDAYVSIQNLVLVGDIRELLHEVKQLRFACGCFETADRIRREKSSVGVKEDSAPAIVFYPAGSLEEREAA